GTAQALGAGEREPVAEQLEECLGSMGEHRAGQLAWVGRVHRCHAADGVWGCAEVVGPEVVEVVELVIEDVVAEPSVQDVVADAGWATQPERGTGRVDGCSRELVSGRAGRQLPG